MIFKVAWSNAGYMTQNAQWMVVSINNINNNTNNNSYYYCYDRLCRFSAQHPTIRAISFISHGVKDKVFTLSRMAPDISVLISP